MPPRLLDNLVVGIGYAGLATYLGTRLHKFSPWERSSISLGSLALGCGLLDLGKRNGIIQGVKFALRYRDESTKDGVREDWRGEFTGMEYEQLNTTEKIAWLKKEEARIREIQEEEQLKCGKAYIAKEEAYVAYERYGGNGGADWKRYSRADGACQDMYIEYENSRRGSDRYGWRSMISTRTSENDSCLQNAAGRG